MKNDVRVLALAIAGTANANDVNSKFYAGLTARTLPFLILKI